MAVKKLQSNDKLLQKMSSSDHIEQKTHSLKQVVLIPYRLEKRFISRFFSETVKNVYLHFFYFFAFLE